MVSYKELGLVNTKEMFAKAIKGGYAIPAFNFNNMEQLQAIIKASVETKSPVILQVSKGARNYANQTLLRYMAQGAVVCQRVGLRTSSNRSAPRSRQIRSNCANLVSIWVFFGNDRRFLTCLTEENVALT